MQGKICLVILYVCFSNFIMAQKDSLWHQKGILNVSGFLDVFYVYDFNHPQTVKRQTYLYNHNRHNEFNLNLGFIKLGFEHPKYRANLALQTGTYVNDNYVAEPELLKNIFEANVGLSLNQENSLWLDAGVFGSHIGFESAISIENWTMTRSLLAENSPYFLTGAKLTYNPNNKWKFVGLILNGWQRIQRQVGNSLPSFGTQVNYKPSENVLFNWSTLIGSEYPDTARKVRFFNNFFGQFQFTENFGLITGFDIGIQQRLEGSSLYDLWYSPVVIGQYALSKAWKTAVRAEYYQDKTGIIIPTDAPNGFMTKGVSLNFDYSPSKNIIYRLEGRWLNSRDKIFEANNNFKNNNFIIASSIAIRFSETVK
jgi:hypothetical protein